jgi:hypothetical protein
MRKLFAGFVFVVSASAQGLPPRAAPTDYQAQAAAGPVTIAAEFAGHAVPTPEGPLNTDDFVVVEAALFNPSGKLQLSPGDFSLRVNGNKKPTPAVPYGMVVESVKDPDWAPPEKHDKGGKTSFGGGGGGGSSNGPPEPVKIPIEVQRAVAQRVKKASMAEGERQLPQAGLLYFPYRGKAKSIHSVELIYSGPAGNASLELHP